MPFQAGVSQPTVQDPRGRDRLSRAILREIHPCLYAIVGARLAGR